MGLKIAQKWCVFMLSQKYSTRVLLDKMMRVLKNVFYVFNLAFEMRCMEGYSKYFFLLIQLKKGINSTHTSDMSNDINSQLRSLKSCYILSERPI